MQKTVFGVKIEYMKQGLEHPRYEMELRRKYAGFFLACAIAGGGTLGVNQVKNGGELDLITGIDTMITSGSLGLALRNFRLHKSLKQRLDAGNE